jgi:hypothetical protein
MPYALCDKCDAVFVVGAPDGGSGLGLCPYCSSRLDGLDREEAKRRLREPLPEIRRQRPGSSHPHRKPDSTLRPLHPG